MGKRFCLKTAPEEPAWGCLKNNRAARLAAVRAAGITGFQKKKKLLQNFVKPDLE